MKIHLSILYQLVIAGCVVFFSYPTPLAQTGKVFFNPDTTVISPLDSFEVNIEVDSNVRTIHGFWVTVQFDRTLIQLQDVLEGPLLPPHGTTFFRYQDNGTGYDIGDYLMGPGLYADGPGVLAIMKFKAGSRAGVTPLTFTRVIFQDTNLDTMDVSYSNGAVVVPGEQVPLLRQKTILGLFLLLLLTGVFFIYKKLQPVSGDGRRY